MDTSFKCAAVYLNLRRVSGREKEERRESEKQREERRGRGALTSCHAKSGPPLMVWGDQ